MTHERPARDDILMGMARLVAYRSTCSRLQVGAVVARNGRSLVQGYNGAPAGMPHCEHGCTCGTPLNAMSAREHLSDCPVIRPCTIAVHAEANAIAYAAREGVTLDSSEMFTTHAPCLSCAQLIINAGILRVAYSFPYRVTDGLVLLAAGQVEVSRVV